MNCLDCQAWLQRRLDGEVLPTSEALAQHLAICVVCREQHAAALRLMEGLKHLPSPTPPAGFAQALGEAVLQDRRHRQIRMRRRVLVTAALAASILVLFLVGNSLIPRLGSPGNLPTQAESGKQKSAPNKAPGVKQPVAKAGKAEPRNALSSLTERLVDTTREHATVVLVAADLDGVAKIPAIQEFPGLDAGVREASQEVSDGVRAVTRNARRAFDFLARELPMPEAREN